MGHVLFRLGLCGDSNYSFQGIELQIEECQIRHGGDQRIVLRLIEVLVIFGLICRRECNAFAISNAIVLVFKRCCFHTPIKDTTLICNCNNLFLMLFYAIKC